MIRSLFLSAFIFFQINLMAQVEFSPPGAEWCYSAFGGFSPNQGFYHLAYTSDTLIQGKQCKIIEGEQVWGFPNNCCDTSMINWIVYQSEDSIYRYSSYSDDFIFLFRNNMEMGEMVAFPELFSGTLNVESVDSFMVNSSQLKSFELPYSSSGNTYVFDKAGPNRGYFDNWGAMAWDGLEYSLHWYKDNEIPEFYLLNQPCGMFTSVFEPLTENSVSVFPNPVSDVLTLDFQKEIMSCSVYDISGRQISYKNEMLDNKLDVSQLAAGMYFLVVENKEDFYRGKFVKN